jgi:hypothetical protein
MRRFLMTVLLALLALTACRSSSDPQQDGFKIFSSDETQEAAKIIDDANNDLKNVKTIYRANQNRVEDLTQAITTKDIEKVKEIADDLVLQINDGINSAKIAVEKIEKAERMNINESYKAYLTLKRESLGKQIEAFELRRQVAKQLSESFGKKDPKEMETIQIIFREKEESFKKLMEEGKELSKQADQVAKDATKKQ